MSTNPCPQNKVLMGFQTFVHLSIFERSHNFWPRFFKFGTNILFRKSLDKFFGEKNSIVILYEHHTLIYGFLAHVAVYSIIYKCVLAG